MNKCQLQGEYMCMYLVTLWIHVYESEKKVVSQFLNANKIWIDTVNAFWYSKCSFSCTCIYKMHNSSLQVILEYVLIISHTLYINIYFE